MCCGLEALYAVRGSNDWVHFICLPSLRDDYLPSSYAQRLTTIFSSIFSSFSCCTWTGKFGALVLTFIVIEHVFPGLKSQIYMNSSFFPCTRCIFLFLATYFPLAIFTMISKVMHVLRTNSLPFLSNQFCLF